MEHLFELFIRERRYLHNLAETTLTYYREVFKNFRKSGLTELTKPCLETVVINLRERRVKVGAVNAYIRGINVFLKWLYDNSHIPEPLSLKPLKAEKNVLRSLTEAELKAIISFKPKTLTERRLHVLLLTLMDTGLRINEALTLEVRNVDFDNLLLKVMGKGKKERVVPFSYELRKVLYRYLKGHQSNLVFCKRDGGKIRYDKIRPDFERLMTKLGVKPDGAFHAFRRTFATSYIRSGGNPFVLQRLLGHSTLAQTNEYVKLVTEDLSVEQHRTSLLNRLR